jgi:hypothetical protein
VPFRRGILYRSVNFECTTRGREQRSLVSVSVGDLGNGPQSLNLFSEGVDLELDDCDDEIDVTDREQDINDMPHDEERSI